MRFQIFVCVFSCRDINDIAVCIHILLILVLSPSPETLVVSELSKNQFAVISVVEVVILEVNRIIKTLVVQPVRCLSAFFLVLFHQAGAGQDFIPTANLRAGNETVYV